MHASLSGSGRVNVDVHGLLVQDVTLADYGVGGSLTSTTRPSATSRSDTAHIDATLADSRLTISISTHELRDRRHRKGVVALRRGLTDAQYDVTHSTSRS